MPRPVLLLVVAVLGVGACGTSATQGGDGTDWGPLTVAEGPASGNEALLTGTLEITDECVFMRTGNDRTLLVWPSDQTHWSAASQTIRYTARGDVRLREGDRLSVGGGGWSIADAGQDDPKWAGSTEWASEPKPSCLTPSRWFVGSLAR